LQIVGQYPNQNQIFGLTFNNMMFDEEERTAAKHKMIRLASIY